MPIKLTALADQLGLEVIVIHDYINFLDLDISEDATEISEEQAKLLEGVMKAVIPKNSGK